MTKKIIIAIVAVVIGVGLFYGGTVYGKAHAVPAGRGSRAGFGGTGTSTARTGGAAGRGGGAGFGVGATGGFGGGTTGSILSVNASTFTISLPSGNSEIIVVASSTPILKTTDTSLSALSPGEMVTVSGTTNSDGTLTAQSIQVRPATSTVATGQ